MNLRTETKPNELGSGIEVSSLEGVVRVGGWPRVAASVLGCCALIALGAQVRVPIPGTDVPMTLQLLAVLLTGFALPPARAMCATLLYLACGAAGLGVFVPGSAGVVGPTGGYLVGFVVAAWLLSVLKGGSRSGFFRLLAAGAVGCLAVFVLGIAWRTFWFAGDVRLAIVTGLLPFAGKAVVELLLATTMVTAVRGLRRVGAGRRT
ncbi:MAG: biotin transporter BioY [Phycisphaerales bacterium]|nr:MAG: biotin transporter BioY [Phycisphaerales bacterium]